MYIIYSKIFHIYMDVFFFNINWPVAEIGSQSLRFPRRQDGCFFN